MAQRISRAKAKVKASDEPFTLQCPTRAPNACDRCCMSSTLLFNEGYATSSGHDLTFEVFEHVALERLVFEDLGDRRTRLTSTSLVDTFEARDAFLASGMEDGVREGYERLDELLAG